MPSTHVQLLPFHGQDHHLGSENTFYFFPLPSLSCGIKLHFLTAMFHSNSVIQRHTRDPNYTWKMCSRPFKLQGNQHTSFLRKSKSFSKFEVTVSVISTFFTNTYS